MRIRYLPRAKVPAVCMSTLDYDAGQRWILISDRPTVSVHRHQWGHGSIRRDKSWGNESLQPGFR